MDPSALVQAPTAPPQLTDGPRRVKGQVARHGREGDAGGRDAHTPATTTGGGRTPRAARKECGKS